MKRMLDNSRESLEISQYSVFVRNISFEAACSISRVRLPLWIAAIMIVSGTTANLWAQDVVKPVAKVPFFDGLGDNGRSVTTASTEAQRYFNQGLCFLYAFNHDEAIRSFRAATEIDPACAMAWWGIAIANGPNINNPMVTPEQAKAARDALQHAEVSASKGTAIEQALIKAARERYQDPQPEDRRPLDEAYAKAMRAVFEKFPTDADVGALFAESLMDLRPWDLWTAERVAQPGTSEVVATLEATLTQAPQHPLALHLYIHALEASPHPEKALGPANRLRNLQPGLGHMVHMPSHIDVRMGHWANAVVANAKAIAADRRYRAQSPRQNFYRIYMAHNFHMLAFAAMMRGQSQAANIAINDMVREMPAEWIKENAPFADGFNAMPIEVLVRFGRWDDVLAAPEPPEYLPLARAMRRSSRGIAYAAKGDVANAKLEQQAFLAAQSAVPAESRIGNNASADVLAVAQHLLAGEILIRAGEVDAGLSELQLAIKCEDQLKYSEPPDWIHPVRHALGANLSNLGRYQEAEQVYRDDLARLPENGWSLFGLSQCLDKQGKASEANAMRLRFEAIWKDADIQIVSSCFCTNGLK